MTTKSTTPSGKSHLGAALTLAFSSEWTDLSNDHKAAVLRDFVELVEDDYDGEAFEAAREYRRRIGRNNLLSYAKTMVVRFSK